MSPPFTHLWPPGSGATVGKGGLSDWVAPSPTRLGGRGNCARQDPGLFSFHFRQEPYKERGKSFAGKFLHEIAMIGNRGDAYVDIYQSVLSRIRSLYVRSSRYYTLTSLVTDFVSPSLHKR